MSGDKGVKRSHNTTVISHSLRQAPPGGQRAIWGRDFLSNVGGLKWEVSRGSHLWQKINSFREYYGKRCPFPSMRQCLGVYHVMCRRSSLQPHIYDVTSTDNDGTCLLSAKWMRGTIFYVDQICKSDEKTVILAASYSRPGLRHNKHRAHKSIMI